MAIRLLRSRSSLFACLAAVLTLLVPAAASGSVATGGTLRCVAGAACSGSLAEIDPEGAFVAGSYRDLLGRQAMAGELSFWQSSLAGGTTHGQMAAGLIAGSEYRANLIGGLYAKFLHRSPSSTELSFWTQALGGGSTDEELTVGLVGSNEYFELAENSVPRFIGNAYLDLLGREPTNTERTSWQAQLSGSTTRAQMAENLVTHDEYRAHAINGLYAKFLHRPPSAVELNAGVQSLGSGATDEEIIAGLVGSAEYAARDPGWAARVEWGDGTASAGTVAANGVSGSHAYRAFGTFPVVVTLTDDRGVSAAVGATAEVAQPPNDFELGAIRRIKSRGTAILPVKVPGPGMLLLAGKGVVKRATTTAGGTVKLVVKSKGATRDRLDRSGRAKLKVTVSYTPTYGLPNQQVLAIGLRKSRQ
jgi:hypothetical protein